MSAETATNVVLLRGVNVGGHGKLPMHQLRTICESVGCRDVRTYIQSGNVVLTCALSSGELRAGLERAIGDATGFSPAVFVRTARELAAVHAAMPFPGAAAATVHVAFLQEAADPGRLTGIEFPPEEFVVSGREIYLRLPDGTGRARLPAALDRRLGTASTVRNWRTVTKLVEMSGP